MNNYGSVTKFLIFFVGLYNGIRWVCKYLSCVNTTEKAFVPISAQQLIVYKVDQ